MKTEFDLVGLDKAIERIKALPNNLRKKVVMGALRRAARVVTKAAKVNAMAHDDPETGRKIASNVQQRFAGKTYKNTGNVMYRIGVTTPKGRIPKGNPDQGDKGPTPHWHLLELGTEQMAAKPFMLPALTANIDTATNTFAAEVEKGLNKL